MSQKRWFWSQLKKCSKEYPRHNYSSLSYTTKKLLRSKTLCAAQIKSSKSSGQRRREGYFEWKFRKSIRKNPFLDQTNGVLFWSSRYILDAFLCKTTLPELGSYAMAAWMAPFGTLKKVKPSTIKSVLLLVWPSGLSFCCYFECKQISSILDICF